MKRSRVLLIVLAIVVAISMLSLTACNKDKHEHTYGEWQITTEPTATEKGSAKRVCECGEEEVVELAVLTDTTVWKLTETQPTHEADGSKVYTSEFGTVTVTVAKIEHAYTAMSWKDGKKPTLTEGATAVWTCECGAQIEEGVATLSNASVWTKNAERSVAPTHAAEGKDVYESAKYGEVEVTIEKIAHTYTFKAWKDSVKPTVEAGATAIMKCECGNETEETVAALSDTTVWTKDAERSVPATHTEDGNDVYVSVKYGDIEVVTASGVGAHTYAFKVWKNLEPTLTDGATAIMVCACGNETEETVAALSDATVWTKNAERSVAPTHYENGIDVYESAKYPAVEVTVEKIAHTYTFKAWKDGEPTLTESKVAIMRCECGDEVENVAAALSDATVWTKDSERSVAATYNKAGVSVYVSAVYGDVTVTLDKLVAAYDGKKYSVQLFYANNNVASGDTAKIFDLDASGKGVDTFIRTNSDYYKDAKWSFALVDDTKSYGKIIATLTFMEKQTSGGWGYGDEEYGWEQPEETYEAKTEVYHGYVDVNGNIVLAKGNERYAASQYILTPCVTALTSENYKTSYAWNNGSSKAVAVIVNDVRFNIYSTNENVYMNVSFVDINGLAINAEDIADSKSVKVEFIAVLASDGTKIAAFAKQGDALVATDGIEGVYTNEGATLTVYGNGTFLYVNGEGTFNGEYIANGEGFDAYIIVDGARVGYYYATIDSANKTFTIDEVKVTITFNVGEHGVAIPAAEVSKNIPYDLTKVEATASNANYKFIGWYADEAYAEKLTEITPTGDVTVYALFVDKITVTVVGVKTGDPTEISLAAGDVILTKLPAYTSDTLNDAGTKVFRGWYVGTEEDAIMLTEDIVLSFDEIIETIWAKWVDTTKLTIDYADKKNNDVIVYAVGDTIDLTEYKVNVGAYDIFEDFYTEAEYVNRFTATVINADINVYAKFNVSATPFYGTSKGIYLSYKYTYDPISSALSKEISVDLEGNVTGQLSGNVVFTNTEKTAFTVGDYKGIFDAETGLIFFSSSDGKISSIFCYGADGLTIAPKGGSSLEGSHCASGMVAIMNLVITKGEVDTIVPAYFYHGEAFVNVHFTDANDTAITDMRALGRTVPNGLKVYNADNELIDELYKKGTSDLVRKDGFEGTYTGDKGEIVMDGLGTLTIDGGSALAYTVNDKVNGIVEYTSSTENVILTLNVAEKTYTAVVLTVTLTFEMEGHGDAIAPITINKNVTYKTALPTPTAEGYVLEGWYLTRTVADDDTVSYSDQVYASSGISNTYTKADVTVYAKWAAAYKITYVTEHGETPDAVNIKQGAWFSTSDLPSMPEMVDGLYFDGWQKEDGTKITGIRVTSNMTITAIWVPPVTLTVVYGNGVTDKALSVKPGATIDSTQYVINDVTNGKIAMGYYTDSALTTEFTATSITEDTTIYAKWVEAGTYTITLGNTYGFAYDSSDNSWKNANKGVKSSTASLTITAVDGPIDVRFSYWYSSENSDRTTIKCAGKQVVSSGGIMTAAEAVNIVTVLNAGETIEISYSKDYSVDKGDDTLYIVNLKINSMAVTRPEAPDFMEGTYTCEGKDDLVLDGFGGYTRGEQTGKYKRVKGESFNAVIVIENIPYKLTITDNTYAIEEYKVAVSYDLGATGATLPEEQKYYGENFTLPAAPTVEGYVFRAWYSDAEFNNEITSAVVLTGDTTFFAKYDKAVTVTFDYNGQGTEAFVVRGKAVGDKLLSSDIPTVSSDVLNGTQNFAGWFTKNEVGEFDTEVSTSTVLQGDVTYYAKWVDAPKSYGTYKGWNYYGDRTSGSKANSDLSTAILVVDATGKYGLKSATVSSGNSLTEAQANVEEGVLILNNVYHYFSRDLGLVWRAFGDKADTVGTDTYLGFDISRVAKVDYVGWNDVSFNGVTTYTGFITITYNDNTTRNAFLYNNIVVKDVKWNSGVTTVAGLKDLTTSGIDVFNSSDVQIFKIVNKEILIADGKAGTYTGEYGEIALDGYGTATIGENSFAYACSENVISFVYANAMRSITLAGNTYAKALDGYEGTYTLPDGTSTLTLDGYGNAGDGKTYVISGASVKIYDGETVNTYGINVESKTFLGKSIFAGYTFVGSYWNSWDEQTCKLTIVFDDSPTISGVLYSGSGTTYYFNFTAEMIGNVITFTFGKSIDSSAPGKTMTATLSGNTITITDMQSFSNAYTFNSSGSATCADFAG